MRIVAKFASAAVAAALLSSSALAGQEFTDVEASHTSDSFDLIVMRPIGLLGLGVGAALWVPAAAMAAVVKPSEIMKPTEALILKPFRYVFSDPIGSH